jgi:hypothetical protein
MAAAIPLDQAQARLNLYMTAEAKVLAGQSYKIEGREMRRADLDSIRQGIEYWSRQVNAAIQSTAYGGRGRSRVVRVC